MNIFLVGPMGVGKTTIGRSLARQLGLKFYDSDQEIERRAGADISWIFDVEGEPGFRDRETQMIDELTQKDGVLIATGGGSVLRQENREMLHERGVVIFLDTSLELLVKRTEKDKKRPLLQNADREEVLTRIKRERQPLYEETAHMQVFVGEGSSKKIVTGIVQTLHDEGYIEE
ncbi:MAG: shikimate kinase AroK [Pseudomonadales bacterium]|nr:shikimate kinase AroK [Pseudomonadales bacterium]